MYAIFEGEFFCIYINSMHYYSESLQKKRSQQIIDVLSVIFSFLFYSFFPLFFLFI
jgi:hypothetical protein